MINSFNPRVSFYAPHNASITCRLYRHPAICLFCHFSLRSRRIWYCFLNARYSRIKSETSPSSPSKKLVAKVSESTSVSATKVSNLAYKAGGENGYPVLIICGTLRGVVMARNRALLTFNAASISACFACHWDSRSFASANFSSAALRACCTSCSRVRMRSTGSALVCGIVGDGACGWAVCAPCFCEGLEVVLRLWMCCLVHRIEQLWRVEQVLQVLSPILLHPCGCTDGVIHI